MVSFPHGVVRVHLNEVASSFLVHVHLTMDASLLCNQTCFLYAVSSRKERNSAKKYGIITARHENVETSSPVNTRHDAPESTNQKTPLPVGVKETLARQPNIIVLCEWNAFPE